MDDPKALKIASWEFSTPEKINLHSENKEKLFIIPQKTFNYLPDNSITKVMIIRSIYIHIYVLDYGFGCDCNFLLLICDNIWKWIKLQLIWQMLQLTLRGRETGNLTRKSNAVELPATVSDTNTI